MAEVASQLVNFKMSSWQSYKNHAWAVLTLGLPLAGSHLAQFAVNVVDVIMMGWYGVEALAAVVLGTTVYYLLFLFGAGFAHAVMPLVAEANSAGYAPEVRRSTRMGLWVVTLFALAALPLFLFSEPLLRLLGQEAGLSRDAAIYLAIVGFQMFPALVIMVLKSFLSALERTQFIFWLTIATAALNAGLNWVLIFGHFGLPELGIMGCAMASLIANTIGCLVLAVYAARLPALRSFALFGRIWHPDFGAIWRVFRLGLPIGLTMLAEVGLFSAAAFMFGWIGVNDLAAHGIALQIASATFLVHLGMSHAATVRVGRAVGRRDSIGLRDGAMVATVISLVLACITAIIFLTTPEPLLGLFLDPSNPQREDIIAIGAVLLMIAGVFQIADATQVMAIGLLRGLKDTQVPLVISVFSYWGLGAPASYVLAFPLGMGGAGVWWGLVIGLTAASALLSWRFWARMVWMPMPGYQG